MPDYGRAALSKAAENDNKIKVLQGNNQGEKVNIDGSIRLGQRQKTPIVTFTSDDGRSADYTKLKPVFSEKSVPFTMGIISGFIGNSSYMNKEQIFELHNVLGCEIASHTVSHLALADLTETDIEKELKNSKESLVSMGFDVKNLIYPFGSHNDLVRKYSRKYYRSALRVGGGLNSGALKTYALNRVAFGSYFDAQPAEYPATSTLEYYKKRVDEAFDNNSWLVFMMHPAEASHDDTQTQYLKDLIDYIKTKNIPILNVNDAMEQVSNLVDIGDFSGSSKEYTVISSDGKLEAKNATTTYKKIDATNINASTPITSFTKNVISICTFSTGSNAGLPETAGTLETYYLDDVSFAFQMFYAFSNNAIYKRRWDYTTSVWGAWEKITNRLNVVVSTQAVGLVAAQSTKEITITVAGAARTDNVIANPYYTSETGTVWSAYVKSADTVAIRLANITAADITIASNVWRVTVIKN